ncbi:hypothetical protein [Yeosuana marina]|uniref:hypothetical protein n=1 Tax=Yeosuana marina TaxID=1565536 RepID=UPI0030C7F667
MSKEEKLPIINCHIHVFTGDYVPPYLAKTFLPWPLYYLVSLRFIVNALRWYYWQIQPFKYKHTYKTWKRFWYKLEMFFKRMFVLNILKFLIETYLVIAIVFYIGIAIYGINYPIQDSIDPLKKVIISILNYIKDSGLIFVVPGVFERIVFFILVLIFFKSIRNLFLAILRQLKVLPGKQITHLFQRYVQIGMFSKYKSQKGIYDKLKKQYPNGTHFVGLPMDMEFMKAGGLKKKYTIESQMEGLLEIKKRETDKDTFHPFVFADPRRMNDKTYFDYKVGGEGEVVLVKGCLMQLYLEDLGFKGIKMYPALGYFPFDEVLLPLYKYCVQKNLPIMSHCIKGTIFYRGKKQFSWDTHPVFSEGKWDKSKLSTDDQKERQDLDIDSQAIVMENKPLHLNEVNNMDFSNNFTHPLNFLCVLNNDYLYKVIQQSENKEELRRMFPCDDENGTVKKEKGLEKLKVCLAHFGGDDQWKRFLESDRDNYTSQLILNPDEGINFFKNAKGEASSGKLAFVWKFVDWYAIICSMMLQYENVYADISYILHDEVILPLLKQTLANDNLKKKVLYGSDFYVVRNHKSDKAILADIRAGLTEDEFDQIARDNPRVYLSLD